MPLYQAKGGSDLGNVLFRGDWKQDTLKRVYDFSSGTLGDFQAVHTADAQPATVASATGIDPFTQAAAVRVLKIGPAISSRIQLDLSTLNIPNITRVTAHVKQENIFSSFEDWLRMSIYRNGNVVASNTGATVLNWVQLETPAVSTDVIGIGLRGASGSTNEQSSGYITGIKIYAAESPYMLGDFVTHAGELWKSLLDNNAQEPSAQSTSWETALALPASNGTTAERPSPEEIGVGFPYFDTTLTRPIWSTGSGWVDATGTAV